MNNVDQNQNSKNMQFTVMEEKRNQKIFTFKKMKSENFSCFVSKMLENSEK